MISFQIISRTDLLNTQVSTRNNGKRLGVISQLWVDIDQREVVALSLQDTLSAFGGVPRYIYFNSISQVGDVILVDNEDVIEDIDIEAYTSLINSEVITETGELLGRVRKFQFNGENGKILSLIIASLGQPQIPEQILSTYELQIEEIVSSGPNRLLVFEGAQERLNQLSVGILERFGLVGRSPWKRNDWDEDEWGESDDNTGGSPPIPSPRRPDPKPGTNDAAELPPIDHEPRPYEGHHLQNSNSRGLI